MAPQHQGTTVPSYEKENLILFLLYLLRCNGFGRNKSGNNLGTTEQSGNNLVVPTKTLVPQEMEQQNNFNTP